MVITHIVKFGASLVERVGEAVFLQDLKKTDHEEIDRMLDGSSSPKQQYSEVKNYQGQN